MTLVGAITILELLAKYGPEVASKAHQLIEHIRSGKEPTKEMFEELFFIAQEPWKERVKNNP